MAQKPVLIVAALAAVLAVVVAGGAFLVHLAQPRRSPVPLALPVVDEPVVSPIDPAYLRPRSGSEPVGSAGSAEGARARVPVRIGVCGPATGTHAEYATSIARGAQLQVEALAPALGRLGFDVFLGVEPAGAGNAGLERLYAGHPGRLAVVLGLGDDERSLEQLPYFHRHRLLMFPLLAATRALTNDTQVYAIGTEDEYYAMTLLAMVERLSWTRFSILGDATPHASRVVDALAGRASQRHLAVQRAEVADGRRSLESIAAGFDEAGQPDGIVLVSRDPQAMLAMVRAFHESGGHFPLLLTDGGAMRSFHEGARALSPSEPIHVASAFDAEAEHARAFVSAYAKAFGHAPDPWAALAYDAVALALASVGDTLELYEAGGVERAIRTRFNQATPYLGATGPIHVDARGRVIARAIALSTWTPAGLVPHAAQLDAGVRAALDLEANAPIPAPATHIRPGEDVPGMGGPRGMGEMGSGSDMGGPESAERRPAVQAPVGYWYTDVEDALDGADSADLPILVLFHDRDSEPAKAALAAVWADPAFLEEASRWVLLSIDLARHPAYRATHSIERTPLLVYWGAGACELGRQPAAVDAVALVAELKSKRAEANALLDLEAELRQRINARGHLDTPEAQLEAADFYRERRNFAVAVNYYQAALQLLAVAGRRADLLALYPRLLLAQEGAHFFTAALHTAEEWIRQDPEGAFVPQARLLRGRYLIELGRIDEARSGLRALRARLGADHPKSREAEQMFRGRVGQGLD